MSEEKRDIDFPRIRKVHRLYFRTKDQTVVTALKEKQIYVSKLTKNHQYKTRL